MNRLPESPDLRLDQKYSLLEELGRGGFGVVYRAQQVATGQIVAIKKLAGGFGAQDPTYAAELRARFRREVKLIGQLKSPFIVSLIDAGIDQDQPYMVLEFINGHTLSKVIDRNALTPPTVKRVMSQVLEAVATAHDQGIVHRDLKPDNIMLMGEGSRITAKVLDFGIAGLTAPPANASQPISFENVTLEGQMRGTPAYMAPEQLIFFSQPRPESDIYALGLIALECLTGRRAVDGASMQEICFKQMNAPVEIPPFIQHSPWGPMITRACQKDPNARYHSAAEMLKALSEINDSVEVTDLDETAEFQMPRSDVAALLSRLSVPPTAAVAQSLAVAPTVASTVASDVSSTSLDAAITVASPPPSAPLPLWVKALGAAGLALCVGVVLWFALQRPSPDHPPSPPALVLTGPALVLGWPPAIDPALIKKEVDPLRAHLERQLKRPVRVEVPPDYATLSKMLRTGALDFALVTPLLTVRTLAFEPRIQILATRTYDGATSTDAYLIVVRESPIHTINDLKGKRFCFIDPNSTSGYFLPYFFMIQSGLDPDQAIGAIHWSGNHQQGLRDLLSGQCEVAAITSSAWINAENQGIQTSLLRILAITGQSPQDSFCASAFVPPETQAAVRDAVLAFDPNALRLERLGYGLTSFIRPRPELFVALRDAQYAIWTRTSARALRQSAASNIVRNAAQTTPHLPQ